MKVAILSCEWHPVLNPVPEGVEGQDFDYASRHNPVVELPDGFWERWTAALAEFDACQKVMSDAEDAYSEAKRQASAAEVREWYRQALREHGITDEVIADTKVSISRAMVEAAARAAERGDYSKAENLVRLVSVDPAVIERLRPPGDET